MDVGRTGQTCRAGLLAARCPRLRAAPAAAPTTHVGPAQHPPVLASCALVHLPRLERLDGPRLGHGACWERGEWGSRGDGQGAKAIFFRTGGGEGATGPAALCRSVHSAHNPAPGAPPRTPSYPPATVTRRPMCAAPTSPAAGQASRASPSWCSASPASRACTFSLTISICRSG